MTLNQFEKQLKKINPRFRIRQRRHNRIGGIFLGSEFLLTITAGHIPLNNFRYVMPQGDHLKERVVKRGRGNACDILKKRGVITRLESIKLKYGMI